jgi:3D (Asp-Asp-Asp) domain-containing protein
MQIFRRLWDRYGKLIGCGGKFWRCYWKRFGLLAGGTSVVVLTAFFGAIIPADAVLPTNPFLLQTKSFGGIEFDWPYLSSAERPEIQESRVYEQPLVSIASISADASVVVAGDTGESLAFAGSFRITHYCACTICTYGTGITATGKPVQVGMAAADWNVFPPGTILYIRQGDNLVRKIVEDRGGAVQGNIIDVYVPSHEQALQLGTYYADIYVSAN